MIEKGLLNCKKLILRIKYAKCGTQERFTGENQAYFEALAQNGALIPHYKSPHKNGGKNLKKFKFCIMLPNTRKNFRPLK